MLLLAAAPAYAEMKIAVLNYQQALLESNAAKKYALDAEKKYGPTYNRIKALETDIKQLQDRLMRDGQKMQKSERDKLEAEYNQKTRDYRLQARQLSEAKARDDHDMLEIIRPSLDKAIEEVVKKGGYDLVLEAGAIIHVKPQYDITSQVIDHVNRQR